MTGAPSLGRQTNSGWRITGCRLHRAWQIQPQSYKSAGTRWRPKAFVRTVEGGMLHTQIAHTRTFDAKKDADAYAVEMVKLSTRSCAQAGTEVARPTPPLHEPCPADAASSRRPLRGRDLGVGSRRSALHDSGRQADVRVQRGDEPAVPELRIWGEHERINVKRAPDGEGKR